MPKQTKESTDFKSADEIMAEINKDLGAGALMLAKDMHIPTRFTSGSLSLDISIGGGWSGNQWNEIYGPENHGKTTVVLKTIAANQQRDPNFFTFWVASEHYDTDNAEALGVDNTRVHVLSTQDMALAYDKTLMAMENRAYDAFVIDSYPAMIAPDEDSKNMDEYTQAEGAKMTNKFFRKVGKAGLRNPYDASDRPWTGFFINQPREKIGGWSPTGQPVETTPGGRGKNFAFYTRLEVKRAEWIEEGPKSAKTKVGQVIRTRAIKNKGGPPQRVSSMDYYFTDSDEGFKRGEYDRFKDVLIPSVLLGVLKKSGGWYKYGERQWQGLPAVYASVKEEPDLLESLNLDTAAAALNPNDQRTWGEQAVESASNGKTKVARRGSTS